MNQHAITRAGAAYDLVATIGFATPWTARFVLTALSTLPLGGAAISTFDEGQLLFVTLMGTVVTMWSVLRLVRPSRAKLLADTIARGLFATWMIRAAMLGAPRAVLIFAALELVWLAVQAFALWAIA
ncbi:MAG: hypothetical protein QM831_27145 [Kofleriaceae bacterium]